jgi:hypothetical protein
MLTQLSIGLILVGMIVLGVYCIPSIVAIYREHQYTIPIIALNLLFGWTLLGWGIAMVWACMPKGKLS